MSRADIIVRPSAAQDVDEAAAYLFEHGGFALMQRFVGAVDRSLDIIAENPSAWPMVTRTKRRYPIFVHDVFPYALYYREASLQVIVLAILHGARDPRQWKQRR